nr:ComF family protein [Mammaliicoccus sp. Marseille-Q6498]
MNKCIICQQEINESINLLNLFRRHQEICDSCNSKLTFNQTINRCSRCLKVLDQDESECLDCLWLSKRYELINQLFTIYDYQGLVKELIHQYKLVGDVALSKVFKIPRNIIKNYDLIIPAPIHSNKLVNRTFDHVTYVLDEQNIKYEQIIETKERKKQSTLAKLERAKQENPFKMIGNIPLENKNILIVDDIYTTGLTIHQMAEVLPVRKVRKLDALTFARG